MENWITILTFTHPTQAHLAKAKLQSEGIEVLIRDELTAQVNNFFSSAIGGVKLQVQKKDAERAYEILKASGYVEEEKHSQNNFIKKLDTFSSRIPILGKTVFEFRLIVLIAFVILLIAFSIILITNPTSSQKLTDNTWCIDNVVFQGQEYQPNTTGLVIRFNNGCNESVSFRKNGQVILPGFNSGSIQAYWKLENQNLLVFNSDTLGHVFNGKYTLKIRHNSLTMQSDKTTIIGYPNNRRW